MTKDQIIENLIIFFKQSNAISAGDNSRDQQIKNYLNIAFDNISTNYCGQKFEKNSTNFKTAWLEVVSNSLQIQYAINHFATTLFNNPDEFAQGRDIIDDRIIFRLLGIYVDYR